MKGKLINQHSLPKLAVKQKGAFNPIQFTVLKPSSLENSQGLSEIDTFISQLGQYLKTERQSTSKDMLHRCYAQFKKIRENALNSASQMGQSNKMYRQLTDPEDNKQNFKEEAGTTRSVLIRRVISKKSNHVKGSQLDSLIENKSVIEEPKEVRQVPSFEIIHKLKDLVRQKTAVIKELHEKIRELTLKINQLDSSAKQQVESLERKIDEQKTRIEEVETPVIEIDYPVEILEVVKSQENSELLQKYETICEDIQILNKQLSNRQEESLSLFRLLRQNQQKQ